MGLEQDFPVREQAIPRVYVPPHRLDEWKEVAQDEITRAISHRHSWYNSFKDRVRDGFEMIADRPNLKAFIRNVPNTTDKDVLVRSTLEGVTLDDLVSGMYCDSTYDVRCLCAHLYEGNFLDAGIPQVHETRTEEDPMHFVGMRWVAFRSPAPAIMTSRDFLYFSYEGTAYDMDGNRVLFRFLRSMPMDEIQIEDGHLPPLVRGKISNLHLYRQNGSHVDGFTKAMHSNAGNMPSYIVTKTIAFMFPGIANIETICDARALINLGMAKLNPRRLKQQHQQHNGSVSRRFSSASNMSNLATLAATNACGVCFHKFKMTRSKRRCQSCCREVCKRCTRELSLFDEAKQVSETGIVALRFCMNCTRQARAESRELMGGTSVSSSRRSSFTMRKSSGSLTGTSGRSGSHQLVAGGQRRLVSSHDHHSNSHGNGNGSHHRYDEDEYYSDDDGSAMSYDGSGNHALLTPQTKRHLLQHHQQSFQGGAGGGGVGNGGSAPALAMEQLYQLQQLQQTHQLNPQDHEAFVRLYGQFANGNGHTSAPDPNEMVLAIANTAHVASPPQNKLISIDQLARVRRPPPPPPPSAAPLLAAGPPPPPPPQYQRHQQHEQPHPNAGKFRRHNSSGSSTGGGGGGGGVGWSHAGADALSGAAPPRGPRGASPMHTMPEPTMRSQPDMIPLVGMNKNRHQSHPPQGYYGGNGGDRAAPLPQQQQQQALYQYQQQQQQQRRAAAPPPPSPSHDSRAAEDLETIFRMRMMLFDDAQDPQQQPVESDSVSTTSSSRSGGSSSQAVRAAQHQQRKALANGHGHHHHHHSQQQLLPQPQYVPRY